MEVCRVARGVAEGFMRQYEFLRNVGLGVWHYALVDEGKVLAVVSYGMPCFAASRSLIGRGARQAGARVVQLCRGGTVPWAPLHVPSMLISRANVAFYKEFGPAVVVAYSNDQISEMGTIYQACNAVYTGLTRPKGQSTYSIDGKIRSAWSVRKEFGTRSVVKLRSMGVDVEAIPLTPKHRYLMFAGSRRAKKRMTQFFKIYSFDYPKREKCNVYPMIHPYYNSRYGDVVRGGECVVCAVG